MITVYVIESLIDQTWYTGMAKNAEERLREHNHGKNGY
jgi:predicted GIY-YIG superfamily endonuclease